MKRLLLFLILIVIIPCVAAASYTDMTASDFNTGSFASTTTLGREQVELNNTYSSRVLGTSGLVSYWPFEETTWSGVNGEVKDAMMIDNGTARNGAPTIASGKIRNGGQFDGVDDCVEMNATWSDQKSLPGGTNPRTIMAWVKFNSFPACGDDTIAAGYGSGDFRGSFQLGFKTCSGLCVMGGGEYVCYPGITNTNEWMLLAATYNTTTVKLYKDGAEVASGDSSWSIGSLGYGARSGCGVGQTFNYFLNGSVDEFAIWNRTLNSTEILAFNSTAFAFQTTGTYTSRAFDLGSNPVNVSINWSYLTPAGTSILVSTRSGVNATDFTGWSGWSSNYPTPTGSAVTSPQNRYYQYRAQLTTTDNNTTPVVTAVTLKYNESGTNITAATSFNVDLLSNNTLPYNFNALVSDTYLLINVTGRYKVGNDSFSSATTLTSPALGVYNLTIPYTNWSSYPGKNVTLEVTAVSNNGSANFTKIINITELIDNIVPLIDPILNYTMSQNTTFNITVTASDVNNQALTFTTNRANMTATALTNTSARVVWIPGPGDIGLHIIIITAADGMGNATRQFIINVTDVNDAPTISPVAAITGYHGVRQALQLTAYDPDNGANITFSISPNFFPITTATSFTSGNNTTSSPGTYYGIADFVPAEPEDGVYNVTFLVTDGQYTANTSTIMTVGYCGDTICQTTYETESLCPLDCAPTVILDKIALLVPDRNCANKTMLLRAFNATNRFSCYYQGLVEEGFALCDGLESVDIQVYYRNHTLLIDQGSFTTGTNGTVAFTPIIEGEYKFTATKEDFANSSAIVVVRDCSADIIIKEDTFTKEQNLIQHPIREKPNQKPTEELPALTQPEIQWFQVLIYYLFIPLLLAGLLFMSVTFYDVNKDTLPWLLEIRIAVYEQRIKYQPQLEKIATVTAPVVTPVSQSISALYAYTIGAIIKRFKKQ